MSSFSPEMEINPVVPVTRERQVIQTVQEVEEPLLRGIQQVFGAERGWQACGPTSIALSRIISHRTGVPIGLGLEDEHIQLAVGIE